MTTTIALFLAFASGLAFISSRVNREHLPVFGQPQPANRLFWGRQ